MRYPRRIDRLAPPVRELRYVVRADGGAFVVARIETWRRAGGRVARIRQRLIACSFAGHAAAAATAANLNAGATA